VSAYHCSCGFAINDADEFGDHLREMFDRDDDIGTDGRVHAEVAGGDDRQQRIVCACGFAAGDAAELDDHALLVLIPPDGIGNDEGKHVPVDPSTPDRWYIGGIPGE
jgi:hypothetical protein